MRHKELYLQTKEADKITSKPVDSTALNAARFSFYFLKLVLPAASNARSLHRLNQTGSPNRVSKERGGL